MKRFLIALALMPALALGAANDIVTSQRNGTDTSSIPRTVAKPPGTQDGLMGFNGATVLPVHWTIGAGLQISSGALVALPQAWAGITGKPSFSPVATSGAYADLAGRPSLFSGAYSALTGIPATFAPAAHSQAWSTITSTPTSCSGYGILDCVTPTSLTATLGSYATTASVTDGLATKFNTPAGTALQYVRGDGVLATLPVAKRIETYSGTTNASGQIVVTYPTAFPSVPVVQPPAPALASQVWTTVSSTTTGFTLQLNQRNTVTILSIEVLLGATVPVSGSAATILVVAQ